ncbi:MAG: hypothetical protein ACOVOR_00805 [Rhabdochlamydiaceae bacterium]
MILKIFLILLGYPWILFSFCIIDYIKNGTIDSYSVFEYEETVTVLVKRAPQKEVLVVEELSIPIHLTKKEPKKSLSWTELMRNKKDFFVWNLYFIDVSKKKMIKSYSFLKNDFFDHEEPSLVSIILFQPLFKVNEEDRKKIGIKSKEGPDLRKLWTPQIRLNLTAHPILNYDVYKTYWTKDDTVLPEAELEIYLLQNEYHFPFPCWIEIKTAHYKQKIKCTEIGYDLPISRSIPFLNH